jgi:hypothetical protein
MEKIIISSDIAGFCKGYSSVEDCFIRLARLNGNQQKLDELSKRLMEVEKSLVLEFKEQLKDFYEIEYLDTESVRERFIAGVRQRLEGGGVVICLDRNIIKAGDFPQEYRDKLIFLDCTRIEGSGLVERPGTPPLEIQCQTIRNVIDGRLVTIADDVLFGGDTLRAVVKMLNIPVRDVYFAIEATGNGGREKLTEIGLDVEVVESRECVDEICARDFFFGLPQSGRIARLPDGQFVTKPYFRPFGDTNNASIPEEWQREFSLMCLKANLEFWRIVNSDLTVDELRYAKPFVPSELGLDGNSKIVDILGRAIAIMDF